MRRIAYDEPSTQYMFNQYPATPPRSDSSSQHRHSRTSNHRHSRSRSDSDRDREYRHSNAKRSSLKPTRQHRKERIIIVDAPPTPTTPPQLFASTFSAPSSPDPKGRPIIVDERAYVDDHRRTHSPPRQSHRARHGWDTPSSSHTSFDLRAEREREERAARKRQEREQELDDEMRRAHRIHQANEDIKRRQAIPIPPPALKDRPPYRRQVTIDQGQELDKRMGALVLDDREQRVVVDEKWERREREKKDREIKARLEKAEEEAMRQRLRERQLPRRRFTVGPGHRRHRVLYDDGVYRWE